MVRRLSDRSFAVKISTSVLESYEVVDEAILFDPAWGIALDTGCSGFDSYFIALAKLKKRHCLQMIEKCIFMREKLALIRC